MKKLKDDGGSVVYFIHFGVHAAHNQNYERITEDGALYILHRYVEP